MLLLVLILLSVNKSINQIRDLTSFPRVHTYDIARSYYVIGELFAFTLLFIVKGNSDEFKYIATKTLGCVMGELLLETDNEVRCVSCCIIVHSFITRGLRTIMVP